ncbi:3-hydroxyisobutyrate dehydrogenase [Janthinobacterium sp. B9-8]|nr:3-hydroxyisobutyrate dehydrogenase [Janthinobacterium sp. B9-8]
MVFAPRVFAQDTELEAAKLPLQNYIRAHETGNADFVRKAFSNDAKIVGHISGNLISWSVEQYAGRFNGKAASDEAQRKRSFEIIDITGDAAIAKVMLDYPSIKFVDYMALLKIEGEWKITHKSFNVQAKPVSVK